MFQKQISTSVYIRWVPKIINHETREVEVAEAAWRVVLAQGVRGLSVRNVAAEAGLATGSLRRAFSTQSELLKRCALLIVERAQARIAGVDRQLPAREYVEAVLSEALPLDAVRRGEMEVWLALSHEPDLRDLCRKADQGLYELCRDMLEHLRVAGVVDSDLDPTVEGIRLHALIDGLALHLVRGASSVTPEESLKVLRHHLRGLSAAG